MEARWKSSAFKLILLSWLVAAEILLVAPPPAMADAALPQASVDTSFPAQGNVISVPSGGDLQAALDGAAPGDVIELAAGATYTGNFVVSKNMGASKVWIRSSAWQGLPPSGVRVSPANASAMAKILSPSSDPALRFDFGASGYYLTGLEITTTSPTNFNMVLIGADAGGNSATSAAQLPDQVIFDRCYVHGTPSGNIRRGITANGGAFAIVDSYISDIHEAGADSQAVGSWNGAGPFKIVNNYLEGAGENVMFGGADASIPNLTPSDIEIRGNLISKPLEWKGSQWTVKNLLELKNAQRVLVDGNTFQNWWEASQSFPFQLTPRNQDGGNPWAIVQDVTWTNNTTINVDAGFNITGTDGDHPSQRTQRIAIRNNLFTSIHGTPFQVLMGVNSLTIDHNTVMLDDNAGVILSLDNLPQDQALVFTNNIIGAGKYALHCPDAAGGSACFAKYVSGGTFTTNAIYGPWPTPGGSTQSDYSGNPGNFFPADRNAVGFNNLSGGDFRLAPSSPYKGMATDGGDIGAELGVASAAELRAGSTVGSLATSGESSGGGCSLDPRGASRERTSLASSLAVLILLAQRSRRRRRG